MISHISPPEVFEQLLFEFRDILFQRGVVLNEPAFDMLQATTLLGSYNPNTRVLGLAETLLIEQPWWVVVEVLRHEMAHMYVNEVMGLDDSSHGENFQYAAKVMGLSHEFSKATVEQPGFQPWFVKGEEGACNPLMRRVEKLLALSESHNENEAKAALKKAQVLLQKHNLEARSPSHDPFLNYEFLVVDTGKKRLDNAYYAITAILREFYGVSTLCTSTYSVEINDKHRAFYIFGDKQNILMAEYIFHYLLRELDYLWKQYQKENQTFGVTSRNSFRLGVIDGFRSYLEEKQKVDATATVGQELMLQEGQSAQRYLSEIFPRTVSPSGGRRSRFDSTSYSSGKKSGSEMRVNTPVSRSQSVTHLLNGDH